MGVVRSCKTSGTVYLRCVIRLQVEFADDVGDDEVQLAPGKADVMQIIGLIILSVAWKGKIKDLLDA